MVVLVLEHVQVVYQVNSEDQTVLHVSYVTDPHDVGMSHNLLSALGMRQVQDLSNCAWNPFTRRN